MAAGAEIERLIQLLSKLPGYGPRSARRGVLHLLKRREALMQPLARALDEVAATIVPCAVCGNLDTRDPCGICADRARDQTMICVVADVADLWALERSAAYRGLYHVLGGVLSALDGVMPGDLNLRPLITRAGGDGIGEIILALNATMEGQATAHYLMDMLAASPAAAVKVTRLAHGVPVGGELDYLDEGTLAAAMKARRV
jgi:recombination protein RecR